MAQVKQPFATLGELLRQVEQVLCDRAVQYARKERLAVGGQNLAAHSAVEELFGPIRKVFAEYVPSETPQKLTAKELDYSMRLHGRILILRERLKSTQLPDPQEITKELHALEWAVQKITITSALSATLRSVAPHVDGQDFYELCQQYRNSKEMMPPGIPNTVQAFNNLREYIKTGKLPWPSYEEIK